MKKKLSILPQFSKRVAGYAAGAAAFACAGIVQAGLVTADLNQLLENGTFYFGIDSFDENATAITVNYLGMDNTSADFGFLINSMKASVDTGFEGGKALALYGAAEFPSMALKNFAVGSSVDGNGHTLVAGDIFDSSMGGFQDTWQEGVAGFAGFTLNVSGRTHHGWVEIVASPNLNFGQMQVVRFGVETARDTPILIVPEPAHSGLAMAAGALGLVAWRKLRDKRRARAQAQ